MCFFYIIDMITKLTKISLCSKAINKVPHHAPIFQEWHEQILWNFAFYKSNFLLNPHPFLFLFTFYFCWVSTKQLTEIIWNKFKQWINQEAMIGSYATR